MTDRLVWCAEYFSAFQDGWNQKQASRSRRRGRFHEEPVISESE